MEFNFILGRAGSGKTAYCLNEMKKGLEAGASGAAFIMLLPEHATFKTEKQLAGALGAEGFARAYVFGFKRFAERVLLETGGGLEAKIDEFGKRMLLGLVLEKRKKSLRYLARASAQRNFSQSLVEMIGEFKSYAVTPEELENAAQRLADTPLKDKLRELSLIYGDFSGLMRKRYNDGEDYLDLLAKKLKYSATARGAHVFIDGFAFFNPQEAAILTEIAKAARSVTVTLTMDDYRAAQRRLETDVFHWQWQTLQKLLEMVKELGAPYRIVELGGAGRFKKNGLRHIEARLFHLPLEKMAKAEGVRLVEAANRRIEVEGAAADILRLCREQGYRWRDIGVLVRDGASYHDLLTEVFHDFEIEFFSDAKRPCMHHPLAELARSSLEALQGWRYEPLFRCFKTDFFAATREEVDILENYALEFGIRGKRWLSEADWAYRRHLLLDGQRAPDEGEAEKLLRINAIRRALMGPLLRFSEAIKAARDAAAMTAALYGLFTDLRVPEKLQEWACAAEQSGDLAQAREHRQVWDSIVRLMDRLVEIAGEEPMGIARYSALVNDGLEALTISLIPPGLDYVTIASFDQNSLDGIKAVYVVGANEGALPRRSRGEGLLTDAERLAMADLGIELQGGLGADVFAERHLIYAGFTRASEYLWISCPLADSEGGALLASPLLKQLSAMLGCPLERLAAEEDGQEAARARQSISHLPGALREAKLSGHLPKQWRDVYNWALGDAAMRPVLQKSLAGLFDDGKVAPLPKLLAGRLYAKNKRLQGSVTRFEQFRACPFRHFAQYGLKLAERPEYRFAAPDLGQFLHAAVKRFGDRLIEKNRDWGSVEEEEYKQACREIIEELAPKLQNEILLSTSQHQHLLKRIRQTVERSVRRLIAFAKVSACRPVELEASFGRGRLLPPLTYALGEGYTLEVTGQVDRIDAFDYDGEKYFLVVDYKSGDAYLNLIDVYYGLKMQLLTYLLVVWDASQRLFGQKAIPAGVLYCFLKNPLLNEKHKISEAEALAKADALLKMPGWIMADVDVIRQIDASFKFIKVAVTTKGEIHGANKNSVKTPEEFAALLRHMGYLLEDTGARILSGDIAASPYEINGRQACAYCRYRALCRFDPAQPGGRRKLAKLEDEEIMKEMMKR